MSENAGPRTPGWWEVFLVAGGVVLVVVGVAIATSLAPEPIRDLVFDSPLAIGVLVLGTVGLLLLVLRRRPES